MANKKLFSSFSLIVFPCAILLVYWVRIWIVGNEINLRVPGIIALITLSVMILLELTFRYQKAVSQKKMLGRDLASTFINVLVTGKVTGAIFLPVVIFLPELLFGRSLLFSSSDLLGPFWIQFILVIFLYSFLRYSVHRIQHKVDFLWKLHSYHHAVTDLKASNVYVSHPLDFALRNAFPPLFLGIIGFDPTAIVFGVSLLSTFSISSHCGAGLHAGWLNKIFVTPEVHRWHHSTVIPEGHKYSVNFGVGFAFWDRLFGTYYLPIKDGVPLQPDSLGSPDKVPDESNYFKLLFLTRFLRSKALSAPD